MNPFLHTPRAQRILRAPRWSLGARALLTTGAALAAVAGLSTGGPARAASLDLLEVGGAYGTPGATNPSAIWWNPAGLAVGGGTQFLVEGAPVFGGVNVDRTNPDYGAIVPVDGFPTSYDYSGSERLSSLGVVPFVGLSSNFLVPGLGVGIGLAVPTARGGVSDQEWGPSRYYIREGQIQAIHAMLGAGYQFLNKIAVGASVSFVNSSYYANTDTTTYPDLEDTFVELLGSAPESFQDPYIEDQAYTATVILGGEEDGKHGALKDQAITFGAGVYVTPIKKIGISLSYNHGMRLDHTGPLTMKFQCPPEYDALARFGAQSRGICDTTVQGTGGAGYDLPGRINLGVVLSPIERVRLEVMGSYVLWSVFTDYEISTDVKADQFTALGIEQSAAEETAGLVSKEVPFARSTQNTFWVGADGKAKINKHLSAGGRVIFDHHGVPDEALSANNVDFDGVILGAMAQVNPIEQLGIGLSFSHQFLVSRTTATSAFDVTIDNDAATEPRYFYPSANGSYSGAINRVGIAVSGKFGGDNKW